MASGSHKLARPTVLGRALITPASYRQFGALFLLAFRLACDRAQKYSVRQIPGAHTDIAVFDTAIIGGHNRAHPNLAVGRRTPTRIGLVLAP
jgi:hypothetical protein